MDQFSAPFFTNTPFSLLPQTSRVLVVRAAGPVVISRWGPAGVAGAGTSPYGGKTRERRELPCPALLEAFRHNISQTPSKRGAGKGHPAAPHGARRVQFAAHHAAACGQTRPARRLPEGIAVSAKEEEGLVCFSSLLLPPAPFSASKECLPL